MGANIRQYYPILFMKAIFPVPPTSGTWILDLSHYMTQLMPQSHPTTDPVRFSSLVRLLARKAEWSARRNFTSVLFSWSHQATGPVRFDTDVYLWFGWIIRITPRVPPAMPVPASYGPRTGIFNVFHILRDPYGARSWPAKVPCGALTDTWGNCQNDTTRIGKQPCCFEQKSYVHSRGPHGPPRRRRYEFCLPVRGP